MFSCSAVPDYFVTPWIAACQAPLSMEFPRQEYWSGLPFPTPGDIPDPGIERTSLVSLHWQVTSLPLAPPGKPHIKYIINGTLLLLTQSWPTMCHTMECSPQGSSVHGILQARILEWVAISFSRGSS